MQKNIPKEESKHDQSFFDLGSIQSAAIGLPGIILGNNLASEYGVGIAIGSILVSCLILWLIGMIIISMVFHERVNAIENIKDYLGKSGAAFVAAILLLIFINWYVLQISSTVSVLKDIWSFHLNDGALIRLGAALGFMTSLLAIGGIRFLKWISIFSLPLIVGWEMIWAFTAPRQVSLASWGLSFSAVVSTVLLFLPGMINLPTFFRHSRSKPDSYLGLTFMMFFYAFLACVGIWFNLRSLNHGYLVVLMTIFLILLIFCNNLLNIYFASACYETFIPRFSGTKGHAIMGLLGTATYTFIQISSPITYLIDLLNGYITSLGVVLLSAFLTRMIVRHRPRKFEKIINIFAWIFGCLVCTVMKIQNPDHGITYLLYSAGGSALFFLIVLFIEETVWSSQKIFSQPN